MRRGGRGGGAESGAAQRARPRAVVAGRSSPGPSSLFPATPPATGDLSVKQLAGQCVVYSYAGLTPPPALLTRIREGQAAGVVFFAQNIAGVAQIRRVARRLQRAAARSSVKAPLLLMVDQEGGPVRRLPGAPLASEKQIGAAADPAAAAAAAGRGAARTLAGAAMNVNLAPVLDVYRSPGDFIDEFGRSYGRRPGLVGSLGAAFITAQQRAGVLATAKHFPGLGAATREQNTDLRPVTLPVPLATLRDVDERPYRPAIAAGARVVMLSWATYPAIDARRPAGLSPTVIGGELRGRLGFTGVTLTDAMGAGALSAFGPTPDRAVLAAGAGMDLLLCTGTEPNVSMGARATDALATAVRDGGLARPALEAAAGRVLALRAGLAASTR